MVSPARNQAKNLPSRERTTVPPWPVTEHWGAGGAERMPVWLKPSERWGGGTRRGCSGGKEP